MRHLALLAFVLATPAFAENLIANPGFEPPADNGLAHGWRDNTWGDTKSTYSLDETNPHSGLTCQKIASVRGANGSSQFLWPLKIEAKKRYHVRLWVRAEGNVPSVGVCLRQSPEPYRQYLAGSIEPTREWQLLEFEGFVPASDDNAGLYIWFDAEGTGTVWVDDALVEIIDATSIRGPAPGGNVIPNGSFELDTARTWDNNGAQFEPVAQFAAHGQRSLHAKLKSGETFSLITPCIPFFGDNLPFTLALSARATGGPISLDAALLSADRIGQPEDLIHLSVKPDSTLRRYSNRGLVPCSYVGAYYISITGKADRPGDLWLDAMSLSPKGEAFAPAAPLEAALSTRALANVFAPGEDAVVKLDAFRSGDPANRAVRIEVRDYLERLVCAVPVTIRLPVNAAASCDVRLPVHRLGAFRADVLAEGAAAPLASLVFSIIPCPSDVSPARSIVGGHFSTASDWQMTIARRLGYRWTRIHDCSTITHWATVEPKKGEWHFADEEVVRVRSAGLEILGEFLRVPEWATTAQKGTEAWDCGTGPFRDTAEFEDYVRTTVMHYKNRIKYWEIWNEPYGSGFWGGTAEQYADLAKAAARAARAADPACHLLAPCTTPYAPDWTPKVIAAGGLTGVDIFSYHGYGCLAKPQYDLVNTWATREGELMPRWNTETGVTADTFYQHICDKADNDYIRWIGRTPVSDAVAQSLKLFVLAIASGADRYFYYWTNVEPAMCPRMNSMSIYEYDRSLRPHGVVYAIAGTLLDPCRGAGVREYPGGVTACYLQRDNEAVVVVWTKAKGSPCEATLAGLPAGTRALDTMGNPLAAANAGRLKVTIDNQPIYVIAPGARATALSTAVSRALRSDR
jgi:hypothetical protein